MKLHVITIFASVLLMATAVGGHVKASSVQQLPEETPFLEVVRVDVNCTTASVTVGSLVLSNNTNLVHFPAEINMTTDEWENVTGVMAGFSTASSFLFYVFNNTSKDNAENIAKTLTNQLSGVFGTIFNHNSTYQSNSYVNVTFTGSGVGNLTKFTEWLVLNCLAQDLDGFSSTFIPMTKEMDAYTGIGGSKESGVFNWTYGMAVIYYTSIPAGEDSHTINILDLLNVESLAPSPYALVPSPHLSMYASTVQLFIISNDTVRYVSCRPGLAQPPYQFRGWYIVTQTPSAILEACFSFGGSSAPATELSFTFGGVVIPEFAAPTLMATLALTTIAVVSIQKQFKRK